LVLLAWRENIGRRYEDGKKGRRKKLTGFFCGKYLLLLR
jgi:hypothetical protein